jgi:hypothetical protein
METRRVGEFLAWLLTQQEAFEFDEQGKIVITKIIADIGAIHKQEILPSPVT